MNKAISRIFSIFVVLMVFIPPVQAQIDEKGEPEMNLPSYYPEWIPHMGKLQEVALKEHKLIINATRYTVDSNVRVHSLDTEFSSIHVLKTGLKIGYSFQQNSNKENRVITEIWILPKSAEVAY